MRMMLLLTLACFSTVMAQNYTVAFMGLAAGGAPSIEKRGGQAIKDRLVARQDLQLMDDVQTAQLANHTGFDFPVTVSRPLVESLKKIVGDTAIIAWGRIDRYVVKPQRHMLMGAKVVGTAWVNLTIYSLGFKSYTCVAAIQATASVWKPPVFFRRVDLVTHITAQDQAEISDQIVGQLATRVADIIVTVVRHYRETGSPLEIPTVETQKAPSIENLFEIPSVEGTSIEQP
jgi:hypothetical protein